MRRVTVGRFLAARNNALMCAALLAASLAVAGCQNKASSLSADPMATATTSDPSAPSFRRTEALGKQWNADPANVSVGMAYAQSLGALGQQPSQLEVLKTVADKNARDGAIQAKVGKQILALGEAPLATEILERAAVANPGDWQILSALGTAYDQQALHAQAREKYQAALAIKPNELSIMNNMGMSYALQGKLPDAEKLLRQTMALPGSSEMPRVRQNLALVVGLQGRFEESQKIASEDLPPDEVQANLAYLQQMLARPNTWQQLQDGQLPADGQQG